MEFIDGKIFVKQVTPEGIEKVELKPGTEKNPLLGQAARGVNEGIATLLGRAGQQRSSEDNMMNVKQILNHATMFFCFLVFTFYRYSN